MVSHDYANPEHGKEHKGINFQDVSRAYQHEKPDDT
jgi:hypothetical protein